MLLRDKGLALELALTLLKTLKVAPRRRIESSMIFHYGFHPRSVGGVLAQLRDNPERYGVCTSEVANPYGKRRIRIYSLGHPDQELCLAIARDYTDLLRLVSNEQKKKAGEQYVRWVLQHSGRYIKVSQTHRLGYLGTRSGDQLLDVKCADVTTWVRPAISVKNRWEPLRYNDDAIQDCIDKAKAHNRTPWLWIPFADAEATAQCQSKGVRLTLLRRQLFPAVGNGRTIMQQAIERFRDRILGELPIGFITARYGTTWKKAPDDIERDLQEIKDYRRELIAETISA